MFYKFSMPSDKVWQTRTGFLMNVLIICLDEQNGFVIDIKRIKWSEFTKCHFVKYFSSYWYEFDIKETLPSRILAEWKAVQCIFPHNNRFPYFLTVALSYK